MSEVPLPGGSGQRWALAGRWGSAKHTVVNSAKIDRFETKAKTEDVALR